MDNVKDIRQAEASSHTVIYANHELYAAGSWLAKPVKTVLDLIPLFAERKVLRCLDLGSGVGRNSIPVAQVFAGIKCDIDCVDILGYAVEKLRENARRYGVEEQIHGIVSAIDDYDIRPAKYDLILAISALEHVGAADILLKKLIQIRDGVQRGGIVCLIMNSGIEEWDKTSGDRLVPQFEVNMDTKDLRRVLAMVFSDWELIKDKVVHQRYEIPREKGMAVMETDVVTWVAQKPS